MFNKASIRLYTKQVAAIKYSFIATLVIGVVTSLVNTVQPLLLKSLFDNINSISAYQILVILAFLLFSLFCRHCKDCYSIPLLIKLSPMVGGKSPGNSIH